MSLTRAAFNAATRLKDPFSDHARQRRMARFMAVMGLRGGERVLDLGGHARFWDGVPVPLDVTILNLPSAMERREHPSIHRFTLVEGDACNVGFAADMSYDIAFSNSVIEHVGGPARQRAMAHEIRRLAPRYWVQTPSVWFPVEAHTFMPFWWFYPPPLKAVFVRRWRRSLPEWCEMVEGTTVLARRDLAAMFPDAQLWTERFAGFPKSYVAARGG